MIFTVHRGQGRKAVTIIMPGVHQYPGTAVRSEVWRQLFEPGAPLPRVKVVRRESTPG